jgi:DNA helicase-4
MVIIYLGIGIVLFLIGLSAFFIQKQRQAAYRKALIKSLLPKMQEAVQEFESHLSYENYFNRRKFLMWKEKYEKIKSNIGSIIKKIRLEDEHQRIVQKYMLYAGNGENIVRQYNDEFTKRELVNNRMLFDSIEKNPLDSKQREAIVHDEDRNLVIAGAGTGKTTTIVGKVAYLSSRYGISPSEILVLAFNRPVAEEMAERLRDRFKICFNRDETFVVHTFHSFGLDVIKRVESLKPDVESEDKLGKVIEQNFKNLSNQAAYSEKLSNYFAFYLKPYYPQELFKTFAEYIQYLRSHKIVTLKNETVKSYEEMEIANFLFLHNIDYEYEKRYEHNLRTQKHRQYRPDFYLPEYKIYIEHWGINRNGKVPRWFKKSEGKDPSRVYQEKMNWKRMIHKQYNTTLIETYSYEKKEGILFSNLATKLQEKGVTLKRKSPAEIIEHFKEEKPLIGKLLTTFLNILKSNQYSLDEIKNKAKGLDSTGRYGAFLEIFEPVYYAYEKYLSDNQAIDFSDMISRATKYINNGQYKSPFKYIIIDEFQDISRGRYKLIESLLNQTHGSKLFCVGDDWQSIYRFTGSDLSIMTSFEKYFGFNKKTFLEKTFRFNNKIAEISSNFIQRNPKQFKKNLKAHTHTDQKVFEIIYKSKRDSIIEIANILEQLQTKARAEKIQPAVFILSRYSFEKFYGATQIQQLRNQFRSLEIIFRTIHKSKGLEADYAIIDNVIGGNYAFPSEIEDDPLLNLVLAEPENFENAEERRVFYVALTRAKHKIFLLTIEKNESKFVKEMEKERPQIIDGIEICPDCESGNVILKEGQYGSFYGCTNFPYCDYTKKVKQ